MLRISQVSGAPITTDTKSSLIKSSGSASLSSCIEAISGLPLPNSIAALSALVPDLQTSLSNTGKRTITHPAYTGTADLNRLARLWLGLGRKCARENASLRTRLQHEEMSRKFEAMYEESYNIIKKSPVAGRLTGFREFTLGCAHCLGQPWAVIGMGDSESGALYFEESVFEEIWGKTKKLGSQYTTFADGKRVSFKLAKADMVREAIDRGVVIGEKTDMQD